MNRLRLETDLLQRLRAGLLADARSGPGCNGHATVAGDGMARAGSPFLDTHRLFVTRDLFVAEPGRGVEAAVAM